MKLTTFKVEVREPLTPGIRMVDAESVPALRKFLTDPLFTIAKANVADMREFMQSPKAVIENAAEVAK